MKADIWKKKKPEKLAAQDPQEREALPAAAALAAAADYAAVPRGPHHILWIIFFPSSPP